MTKTNCPTMQDNEEKHPIVKLMESIMSSPPANNGVYPFSNGSQYVNWTCANCERCTKQADPDASFDKMPCQIEAALAYASIDDGSVTEEIAERMGVNFWKSKDKFLYNWPCPEYRNKETGEPWGDYSAEISERAGQQELKLD